MHGETERTGSGAGLPAASTVVLDEAGAVGYHAAMGGVESMAYDPVSNTLVPTDAAGIAARFLDTDYDGRTFCIWQAFFPWRISVKVIDPRGNEGLRVLTAETPA